VIRQFKDLIRQLTTEIRFDLVLFCDSVWAVRFDSGLLLISPFQCLVVSPVDLTGLTGSPAATGNGARVTVTHT